jgi:hypothetical protein
MMTPQRDLAMLPIKYNSNELALSQRLSHRHLEEAGVLGVSSI